MKAKEEIDKMTNAELQAAIAANDARIAELNGYLRGRTDAMRDAWLADPKLTEGLRALAWRRAGNRNVNVDEHGAFVGVPVAWPDGIDGDATVREYVEAELAPYYAALCGAPTPAPQETEAVRSFRELIDGK